MTNSIFQRFSINNFWVNPISKNVTCFIIILVTDIIRWRHTMKAKNILYAVLITVCFLTGCAFNSIATIFENDKIIASVTNSYSLINIEQLSEEGHFLQANSTAHDGILWQPLLGFW